MDNTGTAIHTGRLLRQPVVYVRRFIADVLTKANAKQIDLIGHSAGGGLARGYLLDSVQAQKVAHYIHIGSRKWSTAYTWFPNSKCLNIYSASDYVAGKGAGDVSGAANIDLKDKDHYEVATSKETFGAIYTFISTGSKPVLRNMQSKVSQVLGTAVGLGTNEPLINARVEVYAINSNTGIRKYSRPLPGHSFVTDAAGNWGSFMADSSLQYEIALIPADSSSRRVSYYFERFTTFNITIRLRGFPNGGMMGAMLGNLPKNEDGSALVVYSSSKAMITGRDSVTVNGLSITSPQLTPAARTVISAFIYDDGDTVSSGKPLKQFSNGPFIGGTDIYLPIKKKKGHTLYYNGRKLIVPAASSKEKILLAVFN
jgi:hypothetical protein